MNLREFMPGIPCALRTAPVRSGASTINAVEEQTSRPRVTRRAAAVFSVIRTRPRCPGHIARRPTDLSTTRWRIVADQRGAAEWTMGTMSNLSISPSIFWVDLANLDFSEGAKR